MTRPALSLMLLLASSALLADLPGAAAIVRFVLGETGVPYDWEYGDRAGKS